MAGPEYRGVGTRTLAESTLPTNSCSEPLRDPRFGLHAQVRLRREAFGGIAFHRGTGRMIEVDHEAFALLTLLSEGTRSLRALAAALRSPLGRRVAVPEVASILEEFAVRGIVQQVARPVDDLAMEHQLYLPTQVAALPSDGHAVSSPITVHWAITYRCGLQCPHCYARSYRSMRELSRKEKLQVVERLAAWGVLEVAIGGGEPTVCPHLDEVLLAVREAGMVPNLTTNGQDISQVQSEMLAKTCGCVQISLDHPEVLDFYRRDRAAAKALGTAALLQDAGVRLGANLLLVPENIGNIERSLDFLLLQGISRVVLLRPFGDDGGSWPQGWPSDGDWTALRSSLQGWVAHQPEMALEVACGLSFLLEDLSPEERRSRLVPRTNDCPGGRRFVALLADGTLWPCSHLASAGYRLGDVLEDDLPTLWRHAQELVGRCGQRTRC